MTVYEIRFSCGCVHTVTAEGGSDAVRSASYQHAANKSHRYFSAVSVKALFAAPTTEEIERFN